MQRRIVASVSFSIIIIAFGFARIVQAGPRLVTRTESDVFSTMANIGMPSFEMIDITPFDSSLGILKEVEVRIAGTAEVTGAIPAGALPLGSPYNIDLSQRFSGIGDDYFRFGDSAKTTVVGIALGDTETPIIHRPFFDYGFSYGDLTPGTVVSSGVFLPPSSIVGSLDRFIDTATVIDQLMFEQLMTPLQPQLFMAPIQAATLGAVQVDYSYIPFGTDAFVVDSRFHTNRRIPPIPRLDPYPTNSEPITMDSQVDDIFNQTAVAKGAADGFELGLFLQDNVQDGNTMEAVARASSGYAVTGSQTDFIRASFTLDGSAAVAGLGDAYIQLDISNGDGEPLAFFNITFAHDGVESFLQEGCLPNCLDDPQPFMQGGWSGSETIDFFIPASEGVIDAILYGFADNGTGEIATLDFLNTASLTIHPTGDMFVTLATGQSFTAIPEPSTLVLIVGLIAMGLHASRGWSVV